MSVLRRRMFQQGGEVTPPEAALAQQGVQQVMGQINAEIDNAQDFEEMINATRGEEAPIEQRYQELATIVGPEDAMQTPESVLALAQPVIESTLVDQGVGGLAQEEMSAPVGPEMTGGIMEMTEQPVQQFQEGGPVGYEPGGAVSLSDYYKQNLPLIQEIMGSEDAKKRAKGQALLDIAQRAFLYGSGVNPATGEPYGKGQSEAQKFAGLLASAATPIGEQLAAYNKLHQEEKLKALEMGISQKSAADAAKAKTYILGKDEKLIGPNKEELATGFRSENQITLGNGDVYNITDPKAPYLVIKGSPKEENITLEGQIVNITDPKNPFVVFGEKQKDIVNVEGTLIDTSGAEAKVFWKSDPKVQYENVNGVIVNVTDPDNIKIAYSDPNRNVKVVGNEVVDFADVDNPKVIFTAKPDWEYKMDTLVKSGMPEVDAAIISMTSSTAIIDEKRQIKMLMDSGLTEAVAKQIVGGFTQSEFAEKIAAFKDIGYSDENATLLSAFGITDDMNNKDKIDRLVKYGNKTVENATQIVLGGLPDKRYITNTYGQVWEITDGKITQTYGDKKDNVLIFDNVLLDLNQKNEDGAPKILMTRKFDEIREHKGEILRITEKDDGTLDVSNVYGSKARDLTTIGRTVLDLTPNKNGVITPIVVWSDEKDDIRNVGNNVIKITKDGYETIYTSPDIKSVNGQLVQVKVAPNGDVSATAIFGQPPANGANWYLPDTGEFVISYDKGVSYSTQGPDGKKKPTEMPTNAIKVDSTVAFDAEKSVELRRNAQSERNRIFSSEGGRFNPTEFYKVRETIPEPNINNLTTSGGTATVRGQSIKLKPAGISIEDVQKTFRAKDAWADAHWAGEMGIGLQATFWAAFDKYITGTLGTSMAAPEVAKAQQILRSIIVLGRAAFVNNPRFPVYEMRQARELFADPDDWFGSPEVAKSKMRQLKALAIQRLENNLIAIEGGHFPADDTAAMISQNVEIKNLLYLLQTVPYGTASEVSSSNYSFGRTGP